MSIYITGVAVEKSPVSSETGKIARKNNLSSVAGSEALEFITDTMHGLCATVMCRGAINLSPGELRNITINTCFKTLSGGSVPT